MFFYYLKFAARVFAIGIGILLIVVVINMTKNIRPSIIGVKSVQINDVVIDVELVKTQEQQILGLEHNRNINNPNGVLYIYPTEQRQKVSTKNKKSPFDVLFITVDGVIVDSKSSLQPCEKNCTDYQSVIASRYVLQLQDSFVLKNDISIGDKVKFIY